MNDLNNAPEVISKIAEEMTGSPGEMPQNPEELLKSVNWGTFIKYMISNPDAQREFIKIVKSETGFNIEPFMEMMTGKELPDKVKPLEKHEVPLRDIAISALQMKDDGYSNTQIARQLHVYPSVITYIMSEEGKWRDMVKKIANQKIDQTLKVYPWYIKLAAKFIRPKLI